MTQIDMFPETLIGQTPSLQQAIPASRSALQAGKEAQKTLATSGRGCINLLHSKDPSLPFLKMLLVTLPWASIRFSMIWKVKTTPSQRLLFQLVQSVRPTSESGFGSSQQTWPTPRASNGMNDTVESALRRVNKVGYESKLEQATAVAMWPTPTTRDHKGGYKGGRIRNGKVSMDSLDVAVQHTDNQKKESKQLNPEWVEWLQGYPRGWTDLEDTKDLK